MKRAAIGVAAVAALACRRAACWPACSGVPTNSKPEVIGPVVGGVAPSAAAVVTPPAGADQRQIVLGFLDGERERGCPPHQRPQLPHRRRVEEVGRHDDLGRQPNILTGVPNLQTHAVTVTANKVGTVDAHGIYTPVTEGGGSTPINLTFGLIQVVGPVAHQHAGQRADRRSEPVPADLQAAPDLLLRPDASAGCCPTCATAR